MTEVVAALIRQDGKYLIGQRPAQKERGQLWEFVGGKIETGETPQQALVRECAEELGVTVEVGPLVWETKYAYPDRKVHLRFYQAQLQNGTPQLRAHFQLRWVTAKELANYPFCPANADLLKWLLEQ